LIPKTRWETLKEEVYPQQTLPTAQVRLKDHESELSKLLLGVNADLSSPGNKVRIENNHLILSPLEAVPDSESAVELKSLIDKHLPRVELSDLLIEVDKWTGFTDHLTHAGGLEQKVTPDLMRNHYASIIAQGCNIGLTKMAQIADLTYEKLAWSTLWYLREETLERAVNSIVNFQYHQPLSNIWGSGTLSSSDGQRIPVSGHIRNATALPRYFGYGKGLTFYTWTSDQFSQYGTKVIPATVRDATYVLDEILNNETELSIIEHTTDTSGYTEIVFALFDLLGMQFAPRIRDIADQRLYRLPTIPFSSLGKCRAQFAGKVNTRLIAEKWDDFLRVAGSLKLGWVTASLFVSKLQAQPRQSTLSTALHEYGRLVKTVFILRYLKSEKYRRRINAQLNKGELLHALREFLFFANRGIIRRKQEEAQLNQALCLNILTNAVITWNTVYMTATIEKLRKAGHNITDEDIAHLSPARFEHINPYGRYRFEVEAGMKRTALRPLRNP
jgi:TnpA family transposase